MIQFCQNIVDDAVQSSNLLISEYHNFSPASSKDSHEEHEDDHCLSLLDMIMENVRYLKEKLSEFNGFKGSKEYKFLKENFTEKLLALDR